jgi:hypothetical protein
VIEFRKIKNMRFRQHGRGDIQRLANVRQILEKVGIGQLFLVFIYKLLADSSVRHKFRPNSHIRIIHKTQKKVNRLHVNFPFLLRIIPLFLSYDKQAVKPRKGKSCDERNGVFDKKRQRRGFYCKFFPSELDRIEVMI